MKRSRGLASIEALFSGSVFLLLVFGILETGRLFFLWNTLHEVTRRGARMAVVCPLHDPAIMQAALFNESNNRLLAGLGAADFRLDYLDEAGTTLSDPNARYTAIRFVRFSVRPDTTINSFIPFVGQTINLADFSTTLPIESLGISRDRGSPQCGGISSLAPSSLVENSIVSFVPLSIESRSA